MFGYIPVQAAIIGCCALGDVDAGYALGFLWDFDVWLAGWGGCWLWDGEVSGDEEEFVVGACDDVRDIFIDVVLY